MFVVVKVLADYDFIERIEFVDSFPDRNAAEQYIQGIKDKEQHELNVWLAYIKQYVEAIEIPKTEDYKEWEAFLCSYGLGGYRSGYISYHSFRWQLEQRLRRGDKPHRNDYNPPQRTYYGSHVLHIVEIPEAT